MPRKRTAMTEKTGAAPAETKAAPEAKAEPKAADVKSKAKPAATPEAGAAAKLSAAAKAEAKEAADPGSKGHSPGEGQKVVTQKYRQNWDAIFGKKR